MWQGVKFKLNDDDNSDGAGAGLTGDERQNNAVGVSIVCIVGHQEGAKRAETAHCCRIR